MASAGVATSAVGRLICVTTAKQIATSTAMMQMAHAGLRPALSDASLGSPIFLYARLRIYGTRTTLVIKADPAHISSSFAPVVAPSVASSPTSTSDCTAYQRMACLMFFETTTMVDVTIRRPPRMLTIE